MPIISLPPGDLTFRAKLILLSGALVVAVVLPPAPFIIHDWITRGRHWQHLRDTPMLWAIGGIYILALNGISEIVSPWLAPASGSALQDATFVMAHFYYPLSLAAVFALFAAIYFWAPKITGWMYSMFLARLQFGLMFAGLNLALLPLWYMELNAMDVGYLDHLWTVLRYLTGIGAVLDACGKIIFIAVAIELFLR